MKDRKNFCTVKKKVQNTSNALKKKMLYMGSFYYSRTSVYVDGVFIEIGSVYFE